MDREGEAEEVEVEDVGEDSEHEEIILRAWRAPYRTALQQ